MTGSGKVIDSSTIGVVGGERLAGGRLLQADDRGDLTRADVLALLPWLACIWRMRPIRSVLPEVVFITRPRP